jgi:hypothetical protein
MRRPQRNGTVPVRIREICVSKLSLLVNITLFAAFQLGHPCCERETIIGTGYGHRRSSALINGA